jgi:NitT/TauT family transport system substrate-binding protein
MFNTLKKPAFLSLVILLLLPALLVAGCAQPAPVKVRIGYLLGDIHHLPFFIAVEKGFFKAEGVEVEVVGPFDAGPAEMDAMAASQLDMGYVGVPPVILAAARKVPVTVVSGVTLEGWALAAEKGITAVAELKSKKIATPAPGSIQYVLTGMMLSKNNMSVKDVELFPGTIKAPDMPLTLQTGRINAYFVWEPFVAKAIVSGAGHALVDSKEIWPGHPCCVVVTRNDFLKNNNGSIQSVINAHQRAVKFIAENPAESKVIAQKYTKLDSAIIDSAFNRVKYVTSINSDDLKKFVREIISLGEGGSIKPIITATDVPDVDAFIKGLIDLKYLSR